IRLPLTATVFPYTTLFRSVTDSTPASLPTCFSIFFTHEGQEKPSARSRVWVEVVAAMIVPSRGGMVSFFLVKKVIPDYGTLAEVSLTSVKTYRGLLLRHL